VPQRELPGEPVDDVQRDGQDDRQAAPDDDVFLVLEGARRDVARPIGQAVGQQQQGGDEGHAAEPQPERARAGRDGRRGSFNDD